MNENNPYVKGDPRLITGPMMPPPPMRRGNTTWQQRFLSGASPRPLTLKQEMTTPEWLIGKSALFFFVAYAACTLAWGYPMEFQYVLVALLSVLLFFYGSKIASNGAVRQRERVFVRNVFLVGLAARVLWMFYCYFFFYPEYYGNTYGDTADTDWYMPFGAAIADWARDGFQIPFSQVMDTWLCGIDDVGYPIWLGVINLLTFGESDVFIPLFVKCLMGAYCSICIYHIAKRHFGVGTARMAALFVAFNPNMIYWCGTMMKETEMVFLCCLSVDLVDGTLSSGKKLSFRGLLPGVLVGMYVFFFRAPLAIVIFLAMLAHVVMASSKVMSAGKKIIAGVLVGVVLMVGMGDRLRSQMESIYETVQRNDENQMQNAEFRASRSGGNSFAKYASTAVFAPLIFTIPFPTFNAAQEGQVVQLQLSGGSYIKNILSYFVILVMIILLASGEWRRHVFPMAYMLGYMACLALSNFAHSGRFHMPIWPMLMLFGAYGVQLAKSNPRYRRWFPMVLVVEVAACLVWNWIKLKGRGMI